MRHTFSVPLETVSLNRFKTIGHIARAWGFHDFNLMLTSIPQNFYPILYALSDPHPIAVFKATVLPDGSPIPDGERTYANACTIKVIHSELCADWQGFLTERYIAWVVWGTVSRF